MGKTLVIVESPAKVRTLSKFLGRQYTVRASIGHVRDLPKSKLGVDVENGYTPQYINIRGKGDVIRELKEAAKKADKILLATDPDREGEAISWHLTYILKIDPASNCRIEFNEITENAVLNAIKKPRPVDMARVDAQQARRVLDRLVGYNLSPFLWRKVRRGLSAVIRSQTDLRPRTSDTGVCRGGVLDPIRDALARGPRQEIPCPAEDPG